ncbi:hypothetical protein LFL97_38035 (plasmid) [Burkholderia sp. JSH-S8]|uniref:hypothetical protein n=1 Tax=Burkholderia stagnalis TaxID=1503054 RepID=UPI000B1D6192|nr:hypothetical protein [Burkholderia stagnalis]WGS47743.1 hypothetical protein LFL97_38035 [Burkholderia sp. JSH-S8]
MKKPIAGWTQYEAVLTGVVNTCAPRQEMGQRLPFGKNRLTHRWLADSSDEKHPPAAC